MPDKRELKRLQMLAQKKRRMLLIQQRLSTDATLPSMKPAVSRRNPKYDNQQNPSRSRRSLPSLSSNSSDNLSNIKIKGRKSVPKTSKVAEDSDVSGKRSIDTPSIPEKEEQSSESDSIKVPVVATDTLSVPMTTRSRDTSPNTPEILTVSTTKKEKSDAPVSLSQNPETDKSYIDKSLSADMSPVKPSTTATIVNSKKITFVQRRQKEMKRLTRDVSKSKLVEAKGHKPGRPKGSKNRKWEANVVVRSKLRKVPEVSSRQSKKRARHRRTLSGEFDLIDERQLKKEMRKDVIKPNESDTVVPDGQTMSDGESGETNMKQELSKEKSVIIGSELTLDVNTSNSKSKCDKSKIVTKGVARESKTKSGSQGSETAGLSEIESDKPTSVRNFVNKQLVPRKYNRKGKSVRTITEIVVSPSGEATPLRTITSDDFFSITTDLTLKNKKHKKPAKVDSTKDVAMKNKDLSEKKDFTLIKKGGTSISEKFERDSNRLTTSEDTINSDSGLKDLNKGELIVNKDLESGTSYVTNLTNCDNVFKDSTVSNDMTIDKTSVTCKDTVGATEDVAMADDMTNISDTGMPCKISNEIDDTTEDCNNVGDSSEVVSVPENNLSTDQNDSTELELTDVSHIMTSKDATESDLNVSYEEEMTSISTDTIAQLSQGNKDLTSFNNKDLTSRNQDMTTNDQYLKVNKDTENSGATLPCCDIEDVPCSDNSALADINMTDTKTSLIDHISCVDDSQKSNKYDKTASDDSKDKNLTEASDDFEGNSQNITEVKDIEMTSSDNTLTDGIENQSTVSGVPGTDNSVDNAELIFNKESADKSLTAGITLNETDLVEAVKESTKGVTDEDKNPSAEPPTLQAKPKLPVKKKKKKEIFTYKHKRFNRKKQRKNPPLILAAGVTTDETPVEPFSSQMTSNSDSPGVLQSLPKVPRKRGRKKKILVPEQEKDEAPVPISVGITEAFHQGDSHVSDIDSTSEPNTLTDGLESEKTFVQSASIETVNEKASEQKVNRKRGPKKIKPTVKQTEQIKVPAPMSTKSVEPSSYKDEPPVLHEISEINKQSMLMNEKAGPPLLFKRPLYSDLPTVINTEQDEIQTLVGDMIEKVCTESGNSQQQQLLSNIYPQPLEKAKKGKGHKKRGRHLLKKFRSAFSKKEYGTSSSSGLNDWKLDPSQKAEGSTKLVFKRRIKGHKTLSERENSIFLAEVEQLMKEKDSPKSTNPSIARQFMLRDKVSRSPLDNLAMKERLEDEEYEKSQLPKRKYNRQKTKIVPLQETENKPLLSGSVDEMINFCKPCHVPVIDLVPFMNKLIMSDSEDETDNVQDEAVKAEPETSKIQSVHDNKTNCPTLSKNNIQNEIDPVTVKENVTQNKIGIDELHEEGFVGSFVDFLKRSQEAPGPKSRKPKVAKVTPIMKSDSSQSNKSVHDSVPTSDPVVPRPLTSNSSQESSTTQVLESNNYPARNDPQPSQPLIISLVVQGNISLNASEVPKSTARFICSHCQYTTNIKDDMDQHLVDLHKDSQQYVCTLCHQTVYKSLQDMKDHCVSTHPSRPDCFRKLPDFFDTSDMNDNNDRGRIGARGNIFETMTTLLSPSRENQNGNTEHENITLARAYLGQKAAATDNNNVNDKKADVKQQIGEETTITNLTSQLQFNSSVDQCSKSSDNKTEINDSSKDVSAFDPSSKFSPDKDMIAEDYRQIPESRNEVDSDKDSNDDIDEPIIIDLDVECEENVSPVKPQIVDESTTDNTEKMSSNKVQTQPTIESLDKSVNENIIDDGNKTNDGNSLKIIKVVSLHEEKQPSTNPESQMKEDSPSKPNVNLSETDDSAKATDVTQSTKLPVNVDDIVLRNERLSCTYKCKDCNVHAPMLSVMIQHLTSYHQSICVFTCPYCKLSEGRKPDFKTEAEVRQHVAKFHPAHFAKKDISLSDSAKESVQVVAISSLTSDLHRPGKNIEKDIYVCNKCNMHVLSLEYMFTHIESEHGDVFLHVCPECKRFKHKSEKVVYEHIVKAHQKIASQVELSVAMEDNLFVRVFSISKNGVYNDRLGKAVEKLSPKNSSANKTVTLQSENVHIKQVLESSGTKQATVGKDDLSKITKKKPTVPMKRPIIGSQLFTDSSSLDTNSVTYTNSLSNSSSSPSTSLSPVSLPRNTEANSTPFSREDTQNVGLRPIDTQVPSTSGYASNGATINELLNKGGNHPQLAKSKPKTVAQELYERRLNQTPNGDPVVRSLDSLLEARLQRVKSRKFSMTDKIHRLHRQGNSTALLNIPSLDKVRKLAGGCSNTSSSPAQDMSNYPGILKPPPLIKPKPVPETTRPSLLFPSRTSPVTSTPSSTNRPQKTCSDDMEDNPEAFKIFNLKPRKSPAASIPNVPTISTPPIPNLIGPFPQQMTNVMPEMGPLQPVVSSAMPPISFAHGFPGMFFGRPPQSLSNPVMDTCMSPKIPSAPQRVEQKMTLKYRCPYCPAVLDRHLVSAHIKQMHTSCPVIYDAVQFG